MLENQNSMDEQLRKKFESFEMTPPDTAWDGIKTSLKSRGGMANWAYFIPAILSLTFFTIYACFGDNQLPSTTPELSAFTDLLNSDKIKMNEINEEEYNSKTANDQHLNKTDLIAESNGETNTEFSAKNNTSNSVKQKARERAFQTNAQSEGESQRKLRASNSGNGTSDGSRSLTIASATPTPFAAHYLNDEEENHPLATSLILPKKPLGAYYFINSANPTKFPFNTIKERKQISHRFNRFSIDGGVGVSTFRINPIDKSNPELKSLTNQWSSGEIGFGAQFGVNYAFRGNYAVSLGIEVISQRNKLIGKIQGTQTNLLLDSVGYNIDTVFIDSITWYLDTAWVVDTTILESSYLSEMNSLNRSTMILIPFSFSMRKALGVRSALEFNLGGSLGIYQVGSGQVILNNSGQVVSLESAYRKKGQLMLNASVKYLYQVSLKQALYIEPRIGVGVNNFYQSSFNYQSRISQLGVKVGYRVYL